MPIAMGSGMARRCARYAIRRCVGWRQAVGLVLAVCLLGTIWRAEGSGAATFLAAEAERADGASRAEAAGAPLSLSRDSLRWRVVNALPSRGESLQAIAFDSAFGLAVGDEAGVSWLRDGAWARSQGPRVRDLAFDRSGRLWIGTEEGLFAWPRDGRPQRRPLRDGEASDRVARIEVDAGVLVVATDGGAYWSTSGQVFQSLGVGSLDQPVRVAALRRIAGEPGPGGSPVAAPAQTEVWTFGGEGLVRTRGFETSAGLRVLDRALWSLPRPAAEAGVVDLVIDHDGARLSVVYPDAIAIQVLAADELRSGGWHWIRPVMPPGALIQRLVIGPPGRVWLVTDRGLLEAQAIDAPFARASPPAGSGSCLDVVDAPGLPGAAQVLALCRSNLLALIDEGEDLASVSPDSPVALARSGASSAIVSLPPDPPVAEIRRRALERVGLSVERAESLWRGLRRRAFWPELQLRGDYDGDRDHDRTHDQSFVSGDVRNLIDRGRGEAHQYRAAIVLDWDLGGVVYPDDSVDLSRELRQVTSLRDDVSDEIHQLYFERQRIRARLADAADALAPGEAAALALRAAELDAGLDAWTGGWLSAWRAAKAQPPDHPRRLERSID